MTTSEGRRERNKRERAARIADAAARLFSSQAFSDVSTRAIADAADVAEGTLFRYAASKTELLVMAFNTRLIAALEEGSNGASQHPKANTVDRLNELAKALLEAGADRPDNAALYQREMLFTTKGGAYVDQGVAVAALWEQALTSPFIDLVNAEADARGESANAPSRLQAHAQARLAGSAAWDALQLTATRRARRLGEAGLLPDHAPSGSEPDHAPSGSEPVHALNADAIAALSGQFKLLARGLRRAEVVTQSTPLR